MEEDFVAAEVVKGEVEKSVVVSGCSGVLVVGAAVVVVVDSVVVEVSTWSRL